MTKSELAILEKAFAAEIDGALSGGLRLFQSRSKVAKHLVAEGYLREVTEHHGGVMRVRVTGYELTEVGRLAYCLSCA